MRPIQLTMTAFGPYKGTETVNFEELEDNELFVISGATGAGKTTIFDGICFALYGQASGEDRTDVRAMRSDFADGDVQTAVELTFAIQDRTYRIMRQIPYIKPGNKTETPGRFEFFERDEEQEVPVVERQIVTEINRKVEEILGFTQAQFSQIVMLPQGEFRKFLTSDTENKESIMRKIFKTDPYVQIVDRLKVKREEAQAALLKESSEIESYVNKITSVLPKRESLLFTVLAAEHSNINQIIEGLQEEYSYYANKVEEDRFQYNRAVEAHEQLVSKYFEAKTINDNFQKLEQQKAEWQRLKACLPEMELKEKKLHAAERTMTIEQLERQFLELKEEVLQKQKLVTETLHAFQAATVQAEQAEAMYAEEASKKVEREQLTENLIRLNDSLPLVAELAEKKEMISQQAKKVEKLQNSLGKTVKVAKVENEKVLEFQKKIDGLEKTVLPLDDVVVKLNETVEKNRIVDDYLRIKKEAIIFGDEQSTQLLNYEQEKEAYDRLAQQWLMNEAATMAAALHDGKHCPVCGSTEHPEKAHRQEGKATVSKEAVESAKERLQNAESVYRMAVANFESATNRLDHQQTILAEANIDVDDVANESDTFKNVKMALEKELDFLHAARKELAESKEQLKKQHAIAENAFQKKVELERTAFEQQALLEKERTLFEHTVNTIPEDVRDLQALQNKIAQLTEKKNEMDRAWEKVQQLREETREKLTTAKSNELHAKNVLADANDKKDLAAERFQVALANSEFPTEAAYKEAKMEKAAREALKKELEQFKQRRHTLQETIAHLEKALEGKEKVNLTEMAVTIEKLKETYEQKLSEVNDSIGCEKNAKELQQNMLESTERIAQLERQFGKVADLYDVVRGQNDHRLSFERYIQIEYLERIIQSANIRLTQLSNGQYEFTRSERQEIRGRQSGLSLDVYDAYTGQNRDVKTLSGGEKFNASLCLALGMADVIQSFQGAVSIETMFIDEGFGSLDEESLNNAIDTLIELQKSGRMIGVISHVEELKAAFPAILEVKKNKEGHSWTNLLVK